MRRKKALLVSLCLVLTLALAGWVQAAPPAPPAPTSGGDKIYNALDPRGIQASVNYVGLAPRMTSPLAGKTILVNQGEADPVIMPALYDRLKATYPEVTWLYVGQSSFGPSTVEADYYDSVNKKPKVDAIIRGNAW
jgi:hypothetical protein